MLRLTARAQEMLEKRGLRLARVEAVLTKPVWETIDPRGLPPRRAYGAVPAAGGRVPGVVLRRGGEANVGVTVHFDPRARS